MKAQGKHQYIWERNDWPNFRWNNEVVMEYVAKVSHLQGVLAGKMSMLGFKEKKSSELSSLTDELINSSEIEGVSLSPASVRSSIARKLGIEDENMLSEDHYIEGLVDVMLDAIGNCREKITDERLFNWHAALFPLGRSGMHKITVSAWRQGDAPMQVVSGALGHEKIHFEAPPSERVPEMMREMIGWCENKTYSPLLMSAIVHLWFLTVHPFDDGNGRISRTISDMFLARSEHSGFRYYSISTEINRNKKDYYEIIEKTQKGNMEITEWIVTFLRYVENAINRTLHSIDRIMEKSLFWERFREIEINERQRKVINKLWDGFEGKLTSSKWAKICHCSQDTALRDITDLLQKGMLIESKEGGRCKNYMLNQE